MKGRQKVSMKGNVSWICNTPFAHASPKSLCKQVMTWAGGHQYEAKGPVSHVQAEVPVEPEFPRTSG